MPRIAIVGSRHFPNRDVVIEFINALPSDVEIMSGGAIGVDNWSAEAAKAVGLRVQVFHADWDRHGRKAGPIRNAEIVANADRVVAFWDTRSRGTLNTVIQAISRCLPVEVFGPDGVGVPLEDVLKAARERGVLAAMEAATG